MKKTRLLALLLACLFLVLPLASCDGDSGDDVDAGGIGDDGKVSWDEVDFKGSTMKYAISTITSSGATFPAAYNYLKGPDESSTDEVFKKVLQRNSLVESTLNLKIEYDKMDVSGQASISDDVEMKVLGSSEDAPDLYTNDLVGLRKSVLAGHLMNVVDPTDKDGNPITSYFDFTLNSWKYDFMSECTYDKSKVYLLAGDYHIDMVRSAYVLYVNKTMFNQNASSLGAKNIEEFYEYVIDGIWDYKMLTDMSRKIWKDDGDWVSRADALDTRVGVAINHWSYLVFPSSTGVVTFYLDEDGHPRLIDSIDEMYRMGTAYNTIKSSASVGDGVYYEKEEKTSVEHFMTGRPLFAQGLLGELESQELRDLPFDKGLVPIPKYDNSRQDDYYTMIRANAEVSCVLLNAPSFSKASAYLQFINENSRDVLTEYYEFQLKFKYNDDPAIRSMIDCVYDTIGSPFDMHFTELVLLRDDLENLTYAFSTNQLSAFYDRYKDAYQHALDGVIEDFAKIK